MDFYTAISPVKNKPKRNYRIVHNVQYPRINVTKQQNITSNNVLQLNVLSTFNNRSVSKKIKVRDGPNKDVDNNIIEIQP